MAKNKTRTKKKSRAKKKSKSTNDTKKVKKMLEGFVKISNKDIDHLSTNTFIRYILIKDGKKMIRFGGYLCYVHKKYIYLRNFLKNNIISWCVQRDKNHYFFKKIDVQDETEIVLLEQEKQLDLYENIIKQQEKKIKKYKNYIKKNC